MLNKKQPKAAKPVKAQKAEDFFAEAKTWETTRVAELEHAKTVAWRVAIGACAIAVTSSLAITFMLPLKRTELKVVRVDNSTGIVDVVTENPGAKTNYDEAVNKYFAKQYVRFREGYSRQLASDYYQSVAIMSGGAEQQRYFAWFSPKNAMSPLNVYKDSARVRITIKSTTFLKPNVALVRYTKHVERGAEKPIPSHWAATITFTYNGAKISEKDAEINPLGFQVTEYRTDQDASVTDGVAAETEVIPQAPVAPTGPTTSVALYPGQEVVVPAPAPAPTPQAPAAQVVPAIR